MLLEPLHGLKECAFLCVASNRVIWVTSNSKAMLDTTVQVDLVRCAQFLQNFFRFTALLRRKDGVGFGRRNSNRASDSFELVDLDERRVCNVAGVDFALFGVEVADDIFGTKAISNSSDFLPRVDQTIDRV